MMTVNGSGFTPRSQVLWNGHPRATVFVNPDRLFAVIPSDDVAAPGTAAISVMNRGVAHTVSNPGFFFVTYPTLSPQFHASLVETDHHLFQLATGDFNEDGVVDLALVDQESDTMAILLSNGDGTFQPPVTYPAGSRAETIATADFNHDGHLDLVANGNGVITLFLGRGDGTFAPYRSFGSIPNETGRLATGDFNGDGNVDVVIAGSLISPTVWIFLNNGDGTFQPAVSYPVANTPEVVAVGDFNRDGNLDVAVTCTDATSYEEEVVSVILGNGDGTFGPPTNFPAGKVPVGVVAADFNGDGILDLAVADLKNGIVSVLLGKGDGSFRLRVPYRVDYAPISLAAADINSDGYLDLIVAMPRVGFGHEIDVLFGQGDGTFAPAVSRWSGVPSDGFAVADFNGDGRPDIAVQGGYPSMGVMLQQLDKSFALCAAASTVGPFEIPLALDNASATECRTGQPPGRYTVVLTFNQNIASVDGATSSCGSVFGFEVNPRNRHQVLLRLEHLTCDNSSISFALDGVHDDAGDTLPTAAAAMALLVGDVDGDGAVTTKDVSAAQGYLGQPTRIENLRADVNADGVIDSKDIRIIKAQIPQSRGKVIQHSIVTSS